MNNIPQTVSSSINTIVLGDSHTQCAVDPAYLENSLNYSESGSTYYFSLIKIKHLIANNNQIKRVLLSLHHGSFDIENESKYLYNEVYIVERLSRYAPFISFSDLKFHYNKSYFFKSFLKAPLEIFRFSIECFKNRSISLASFNFGNYSYSEENKLDIDIANRKSKAFPKKNTYSEIELALLQDIKNFCNKSQVELILVNTPVYEIEKYTDITLLDKMVHKELKNYKILDFSRVQLPKDCFYDISHLNTKGAITFTKLLKDSISL